MKHFKIIKKLSFMKKASKKLKQQLIDKSGWKKCSKCKRIYLTSHKCKTNG